MFGSRLKEEKKKKLRNALCSSLCWNGKMGKIISRNFWYRVVWLGRVSVCVCVC